MTDIVQALKTHFGFEKFRSQQQEDVVKAVMKGKPLETGFVFRMILGFCVAAHHSFYLLHLI